MGVYVRADSPFYWLLLERPGQRPILESTKIPRDAPDAMTRKLARQQAEQVYVARMADLARARYQLPSLDPQPTITFRAYATWYELHHTAKLRGAEREGYAIKALLAFFGDDELTTITADRVSEYETHRLTQKRRPNAINREVDVLKAMLQRAVPTYLTASPLTGRKRLRVVPRPKRVLTPEEETRLLAQLKPADQALYIVAVDTLARLSNVLNLTRDEDHGTYLALTDSKTGPYQVPLSSRARKALDSLPKSGKYFFAHRRKAELTRDRRGVIRLMLKRACARCRPKIPYGRAAFGITFHTATRASGATRMLRAGVDPKTVQEIGHWASFEQMSTYLQTDMRTKQEAVNRIAPITPALQPPTKRTKSRRKSA